MSSVHARLGRVEVCGGEKIGFVGEGWLEIGAP